MRSVKKTVSAIAGAAALAMSLGVAAEAAQWLKFTDGGSDDTPRDIARAPDGSYIFVGKTSSPGVVGGYDAMFTKSPVGATPLVAGRLGGAGTDSFRSVAEAPGGGFVAIGTTDSAGAGSTDMLLAKYSSSGALLWQRVYGGTSAEIGLGVTATSDGGYLLCGATETYGFGGGQEAIVIKTDASGAVSWSKTFGDTGAETLYSVIQTSDGGYVAAGDMEFAGDDSGLVLKLDAGGGVSWTRRIGGSGVDWFVDAVQSADGGYLCVGRTESFAGLLAWAVKLSSGGTVEWQRAWPDTIAVDFSRVIRGPGSDFLIVGTGSASAGLGGGDVFVARIDAAGSPSWQAAYGGSWIESGSGIVDDGASGYLVGGPTSSFSGIPDALALSMDASGSLGSDCTMYRAAISAASSPTSASSGPVTFMTSSPSVSWSGSSLSDGPLSMSETTSCTDAGGAGVDLTGYFTSVKKKGSSVRGRLVVNATGSDPAGGFDVKIYFSKKPYVSGKSKLIATKAVGGLGAGGGTTIKFKAAAAAGHKYVLAKIDTDNDVAESIEANNEAGFMF